MAKYNPYLIPVHCTAKVSGNTVEQKREAAGEDSSQSLSKCSDPSLPFCRQLGWFLLGISPFRTGVSQNPIGDK